LNVDRRDLDAWAGCIAGALPKEEYVALIQEAGFADIQIKHNAIEETGSEEAQSCCSSGTDSITVTAVKLD
jgi:hypothetical protein